MISPYVSLARVAHARAFLFWAYMLTEKEIQRLQKENMKMRRILKIIAWEEKNNLMATIRPWTKAALMKQVVADAELARECLATIRDGRRLRPV